MERPSPYPRTYTVNTDTVRALDAVACAPVGLFVALLFLQVAGLLYSPVSLINLLAAGSIAGLLTLIMYNRNHRRVILYEDGIAVRSWFSCRKLNRRDILGRRMGRLGWQAGGGSFYIIVPVDRSRGELRLPPFLHLDRDFFDWIEEIPRLDK